MSLLPRKRWEPLLCVTGATEAATVVDCQQSEGASSGAPALPHLGSSSTVERRWLILNWTLAGHQTPISLHNHLGGRPILLPFNRWQTWVTCPESHWRSWDLNPGSGSCEHVLSQDPKLRNQLDLASHPSLVTCLFPPSSMEVNHSSHRPEL